MTTFRWLHFTDLHIGQKDDGLWPSAKQALLDDLRRTTRELGPWDVVVFTGDLAFSGKKSEYAKLDAELKDIWALFAEIHPSSVPVLLAVPGNHDLARPKPSDPLAVQLLGRDDAGRRALWKGERQHLDPVKKWFRDYSAWWDRNPYKPPGVTPGLLPGDFAYTLERDGIRFAFLGLNTAFAQTLPTVNQGQLWVHQDQVKTACGGDLLAWARDQHDFSFLLTHHPPNWLTSEGVAHYNAAIAPPGIFTAHFCGHLHESLAQQTRVGRGATREIWQGTSLFGLEKADAGKIDRKHGYTAGMLDVQPDGSAQTTLYPRLGVKRQDGSWAVTADVTYQLEGDLRPTPIAQVEARSARSRRITVTAPAATSVSPILMKTWREAVETSPVWGSVDAAVEQARGLAGAIAEVCQRCWEVADEKVPGDPWRDQQLPIRTLARLAALVPSGRLNAAETAYLLLAPIVREAIFAAGALWMEEELAKGDAGSLARKILDEMERARPDLVRRREKLTGKSRRAVEHWLRTRALRQCPQLWDDRPRLDQARDLARSIEQKARDSNAGWMQLDELMVLVRHVGVNAEVFQAEETIDKKSVVTLGPVSVRRSAIARLLCAAGAWALELRRAEDLVADHAGREGFDVATAREAIRCAVWEVGKDGARLVVTCADPIVDFVLCDDLVARAEQVVRRLAQDRARQPGMAGGLLDQLPAQIRADVIIEKGADGRDKYEVPHVRFQLDHNQIRELLMGENLYGDPSLAIREMYQNALDACRYRQARVDYLRKSGRQPDASYAGEIIFRQDEDAKGPYIECEDNGVGMTAGVLANVFAVAGKRFQDMPEYLEERARWDALPEKIELWPNSRFGIGVLSYFMLGDEVEVWTRRFEADGECRGMLGARISSASGLFRVEKQTDGLLNTGGTRVRVYLKSGTYRHRGRGERNVSCQEILGELLWVSELSTSVEEKGKEKLRWKPGVLSPGGKIVSTSMYTPTADPDVWWSACFHGFDTDRHEPDKPLLVDGIVTQTMMAGYIINLRKGRCRALSVDRNNVQEWDTTWAASVLERSLSQLVSWEGLTMMFVWHLASTTEWLAQRLVTLLADLNLRIPAATSQNDNSEGVQGSFVQVSNVNCWKDDGKTLYAAMHTEPPTLVEAWRVSVWLRSGGVSPVEWHMPEHVQKLPLQRVEPDDRLILGAWGWERWSTTLSSVHLVHSARAVLISALMWEKPIPEVAERVRTYEFLGFEIDLGRANLDVLEQLRLRLQGTPFIHLFRMTAQWGGIDPPMLDLFAFARDTRAPVGDLIRPLALLGIQFESWQEELLAKESLNDDDLRTLSVNFDGNGPWLTGKISTLQLALAARKRRTSVSDMVHSLKPFERFGVYLPSIDLVRIDQAAPDALLYLAGDSGAEALATGARIPVALIGRVAEKFHVSMAEAHRRLGGLTELGVVLPTTPEFLDAFERDKSQAREIVKLLNNTSVCAGDIARIGTFVYSYTEALRVVAQLGADIPAPVRRAFEGISTEHGRFRDITIIIRAYEASPGPDHTTRRRRGRNLARYHLWQPPDEELDALIAQLEPVIDCITRDPKP